MSRKTKMRMKSSLSPFLLVFLLSICSNFAYAETPDYGNNFATSEDINILSYKDGQISLDSDEDYFKFVLTDTEYVYIETSAQPNKPNMDTYIYLYNSSGIQIANNDDGGVWPFSKIEGSLSAGTYYIKVQSYNHDSSGYYRLSLTKYINYNKNNPRDFTMQKQDNIRGNIVMIGNSVLERNGGGCANSNTQNNRINAVYADKDSDSNTYNSTSADLVLPKGIKSEDIVYVLLYWQGRVDSNLDAGTNGRTVKLKLYGSSNYDTVTSSDEKFNYIYGDYQGVADITDKFKSSMDSLGDSILESSGYNQPVWVADVYTDTGKNKYGAWSLIVTYKDENDKLRNITLYDGYDEIYNESKSYTLTNFLTPTKGEVNAKFMVFAGEGDVVYRDSISLTNKSGSAVSLGSDFFHSSENIDGVNITNRNPNCANTIGIDLQTVSVGTNAPIPIIGNGQTETTIRLWSGGDQYFPGVFAFSTQLYEPRVCYYIDKIKDDDNVTVFEDKKFISEIEPDKNYHFDLWISNMKKASTDTDIEDAKLVQVYVQMKNGFDYKEQSTQMKNIGQTNFINLTDTIGDDLGEFESDSNKSTWRVGSGASNTHGGTLEVANNFNDDARKAFIKLEGSFVLDENTTEFDLANFYEFRASFQTDSITIGADNAQIIEQCVDLNTSATVSRPPIGAFNVVNKNFSGSSIPSDNTSPTNALYTQIVGQPFNIKILSLDSFVSGAVNINLKEFYNGSYSDDVNISLISTPDYDSCGENESCKKEKCKDATEIEYIDSVSFTNKDSVTKPITPTKATSKASFRIDFINNKGDLESACSFDSFAIRPATYNFDTNESHLIGGKEYQLDANATNLSEIKTPNYSQTLDVNLSLVIPTGCTLPNDNNITSITFNNGTSNNGKIKTKDIGDYNVSILDTNWTAVDQNPKSDGSIDCIQNSSTNTPDANGKVGCNTLGSKVFSFSPKKFSNTLSISSFSTNNYTYLSNDKKMSANISITTTAILEDNSTAQNYTKNCYAKDINTTIKLNTLPVGYSNIIFFDDNTTTKMDSNTTDSALFETTEGNFTSGIANLKIKFNFPRDILNPKNPFKVSKNDFNITSILDTNGTQGIDFNRSTDQNITFYYGRVHAPDYNFFGTEGDATIYYEVFCNDCNKTDFNITGDESSDSINWFINTLHTNLNEGNVTTYTPASPTVISTNPTLSTTITNGTERIKVSTSKTPYKDKIKFNSSPWLIFSPTDFIVDFKNTGQWAGEGIKGKTVDLNISKRQNRRLDW